MQDSDTHFELHSLSYLEGSLSKNKNNS